MSKLAWIEDGRIRDIAHTDPTTIYTPNIAAHYDTEVPDEAVNGDFFANGVLTPPPKPEPFVQPVVPRTISAEYVRAALTLAEKVKWDTDGAPAVVTAKIEFAQPRSISDAKDVLDFLVASKVISQASEDKVLA